MSQSTNPLDQLNGRLGRLERQMRWWKLTAVSAVLVIGVGMISGAGPAQQPKVIEAEGFIMRDATGVKRVEIGAAGFFVNNDDGKHRISIFSSKWDRNLRVC